MLDTWFSSGLWPFSTLGWPDDTPDMRRFYPTDVMETGYDIISFWVARMVMLGLELVGEVPFHDVYFHGLVRHLDGSKVSKTNYQPGDDPLETIEAYGADAMRFSFVTAAAPGNDMRLDLRQVERGGHFANKLWNGAKFVIGAMERTAGNGTRGAVTGRSLGAQPVQPGARGGDTGRGALPLWRGRAGAARFPVDGVLRLVRRGRQDSALRRRPGRLRPHGGHAGDRAGRMRCGCCTRLCRT